MLRADRVLFTVVILFTGSVAVAQPPAAPAPASPPAPPGLVPAAPAAPPLLLPPPAAPAPFPAAPAPLPAEPIPVPPPDVPMFCPPPPAKTGLFGGVEIGLLFPHVTNGLAAPVTVQPFGVGDLVILPAAGLDSTVAPQLTLGYRIEDIGAILLTYRNLASEGRVGVVDFDFAGDGVVFSRLNLNTVGLLYSTQEHPLGALWTMQWEIGAKLASIYFDSYGQGVVIGQRMSDYFIGGGPSIALDLTRELPPTGLAVYTRAEFSEFWGKITQRYSETVGDPRSPDAFGYAEQHGDQGVPMLALEAGLSWLARPDGRYRLTTGYSFEHYWGVGKVGPGTHGDVMAQGLFMRAEFNY